MSVPSGLGDRGALIWGELQSGDPARDALVLEAARLADRLDELDRVIQGEGVLNLMQFRLTELPESGDEPFVVEVKFQNVLAEARQQQTTLANVLSKLAPAEAGKSASADLPENVTPLARMLGELKKA